MVPLATRATPTGAPSGTVLLTPRTEPVSSLPLVAAERGDQDQGKRWLHYLLPPVFR